MSIRTKMIATLVAVTLLLVVMTLAFDYQSGRYGELKDSQNATTQIMVDILELRKYEKDFLARKDASYVQSFTAKKRGMDDDISRFIKALDALSIDASDIVQIQKEIQDYADQLKSLAEFQAQVGLNETSGLYGNLRNAVNGAETVFDTASNFELLTHMLMLRRAEKDFMLRRNMKYVENFEKQFGMMEEALSRIQLPEAESSVARQYMAKYRTEFLALVSAEQKIGLTHQDGLHGRLRKTINDVESHLVSFIASLHNKMLEAEDRLKLMLYSAVSAIVILIAGLLLMMGISLLRRIRLATQNMQQIAVGDGDLSRRLDETGADEITELAHAFNTFAGKIHDTLKKSAELITSLGQIGDRVDTAATGTGSSMKQLRTNTHSVVTATEELSATARDVANNASQVSTSTREANKLAIDGRGVVEQSIQSINSFAAEFNEAATTISSLRAETENIGSILDVIRSIAEQTNLLALNAAIEAARAGEQGRGFAVVADEVRNLAHRSQQSTNEIQGLIERLQSRAESASSMIQHGHQRIAETVTQAEQAGIALSQITASVSSISDMTTQIATAAEEQSVVVADINQNVVEIDHLAKDTAQNADLTTDLTTELAHAMAAVIKEIQHFHFEHDEQLVLAQAKTAHLAWKRTPKRLS